MNHIVKKSKKRKMGNFEMNTEGCQKYVEIKKSEGKKEERN